MRRLYVMAAAVVMMMSGVMGAGAGELPPPLAREIAKMESQGVPVDRATAVVSAMQAQGMGEAEAMTVLSMVNRAHEEGIPAEPLLSKAEEGLAKRVRGDQVVTAMKKVHQRYRVAGEWSQGMARDEAGRQRVTEAMAGAMAAGMTHEDMTRLRERVMTRDVVKDEALPEESALAVREMVRSRVRSESATDTVDAALEKGYDAGEMARLRQAFHRNAGQGNGEMLANQYTQAIHGGMSASDLEMHGSTHNSMGSGNSSSHGSMGGSGSSGHGGSGNSSGSGHGRH